MIHLPVIRKRELKKMKDKDVKIVKKSTKTATESNTSCGCSCGCGSADSPTTRKSKKIIKSNAEPKNQQSLALESNSNKKEMEV
jgi:hypothetical protein